MIILGFVWHDGYDEMVNSPGRLLVRGAMADRSPTLERLWWMRLIRYMLG